MTNVIVELSWRVSKDEARASRARGATWFETRCHSRPKDGVLRAPMATLLTP
jgi:hypothetical protein